jgi:hypothetical protein
MMAELLTCLSFQFEYLVWNGVCAVVFGAGEFEPN